MLRKNLMTVDTQEKLPIKSMRPSSARLSSDELNVLEKFGEDVVTVNLDITLKPVTWIALQKYALKNDCSLSEALESGLEESDQVASAINIRQSER